MTRSTALLADTPRGIVFQASKLRFMKDPWDVAFQPQLADFSRSEPWMIEEVEISRGQFIALVLVSPPVAFNPFDVHILGTSS